jgi:hypothetical protein
MSVQSVLDPSPYARFAYIIIFRQTSLELTRLSRS